MTAKAANGTVLSSDWTGLSPHLIASFYPVKRIVSGDGKRTVGWARDFTEPEVQAPITEGQLDAAMTWHSPFENSGADQQFSAISALMQTGAITPLLTMLQDVVGNATSGTGALSAAAKSAADASKRLEGRTSMTKLNSTQTFNGMPPLKLSLTAHFRALRDARAEVANPLNQLIRWALPQELAQDGPVLELIRGGDPSLYPSKIPMVIGMQYADMQLLPLVIESVPYPLSGPRDRSGNLLSAQVALQLSTLAAIDAADWNGFQRGA